MSRIGGRLPYGLTQVVMVLKINVDGPREKELLTIYAVSNTKKKVKPDLI